ncbi:MAG: glycosyltransferase [Promethearchaeota archaeon]
MTIPTLDPVSIVVPTKNRASLLPNLIYSLLNLNYPQYEIIIVDDCSTDKTKEILKKYPIKSIYLDKSIGSAEARNIGIQEAKNDIIALTDSDCFVSKNWLKDLVSYLDNYDVIGGTVLFSDNAEKELNPFNLKNEIVITKESSLNFLNTSNMILKKDVWKLSGGFLNYRIEDLEFSWRALKKGYKLKYVPKGLVIHYGKRTLFQNIKKYIQYGKSYSKVSFIHKMSFTFKPEPNVNTNSIWAYLKLLSVPFIFLLSFILISALIFNTIVNLSINSVSFVFLLYLDFKIMRKINIFFSLYKFLIIFVIINYSLIYLFKKDNNNFF